MELFLIRHTHAEDAVPDHARHLSKRGEKQARVLARFLLRCEAFAPEEIWHSPLVRARETAELVRRGTRLRVALRALDGLAPGDDPRRLARRLASAERSVALVGHEPHLSALASLLVGGSEQPVLFAMKKGAALALEREGRQWVVRWHIAPDLLG